MMRTRFPTWGHLLLALLLCAIGSYSTAQIPAPTRSDNRSTTTSKLTPLSTQITAGDLLEISVFDTPELTQQVRVGADGKAELALLGNIPLAGLTTQQAAEEIARQLREKQLLVRPQVNVLMKESASPGASVMGEVEHPGLYPLPGPRSLLDVLSMAGGLSKTADTRVSIKRREGGQANVTVKLSNQDAQITLAADVQVYPGDLVMVPRAGVVYVLGDVNHPGGFVMQDNGKITILQALAQAGGTTGTAATNRAILLRKNGEGYIADKLHIGNIARGKEKDLELQPNDVVFIPNSRLKNALHSTESVASSIGSASIYAVVH
jgi:polysaccharide biosynthesis/export protein